MSKALDELHVVEQAIRELDRPYFKASDLELEMHPTKISHVCRELPTVKQWNENNDPIIWQVVG